MSPNLKATDSSNNMNTAMATVTVCVLCFGCLWPNVHCYLDIEAFGIDVLSGGNSTDNCSSSRTISRTDFNCSDLGLRSMYLSPSLTSQAMYPTAQELLQLVIMALRLIVWCNRLQLVNGLPLFTVRNWPARVRTIVLCGLLIRLLKCTVADLGDSTDITFVIGKLRSLHLCGDCSNAQTGRAAKTAHAWCSYRFNSAPLKLKAFPNPSAGMWNLNCRSFVSIYPGSGYGQTKHTSTKRWNRGCR